MKVLKRPPGSGCWRVPTSFAGLPLCKRGPCVGSWTGRVYDLNTLEEIPKVYKVDEEKGFVEGYDPELLQSGKVLIIYKQCRCVYIPDGDSIDEHTREAAWDEKPLMSLTS